MEVGLRVGSAVVMAMFRRPPEEPALVRETPQHGQHGLEPRMRLVRSVGEVAMIAREHADLQDGPHQQGPERVRMAHEPPCREEKVEYEERNSRAGGTAPLGKLLRGVSHQSPAS